MTEIFLQKLNQIINCDPSKCKKEGCPLYLADENRCTWDQTLTVLECTLKEKFKSVSESST